MNYGLYLSASGMLTSLYKMDVLAGNLANGETPGYKSIVPTTRQRDAESVEDSLGLPSDRMLERLGGGVLLMPNRLALSQGALKETGRPFDVALQGEGFFVVDAGNSDAPDAVRFSRDGRMAISPRGQLLHVASGQPILGTGGQAITIDPTRDFQIDRTGVIRQAGAQVGQLQISTIADPAALRPAGAGLLAAPAGMMQSRAVTNATVVQGSLEHSGVDTVATMVDFTTAERAVSSNSRMLQLHDQLLDRAINQLGKFA